jgi:hypothetical protein
MLASLFSCFKGCDAHCKERGRKGDGRRNPVLEKSPSKSRCEDQCIITFSIDSKGAHCSVPAEEETGGRPAWTPTDGSSSASMRTRPGVHNIADRGFSPIVGFGLGPERQGSSCCQAVPVPALSVMGTIPSAGRAADLQTRTPPPMLLSLRHLHMALTPVDCATQQHSPFTTDSPCTELRPSSVDFAGLGFADFTTSDSSGMSISGLHPQLRFVNACRLGEEVQDLQLLGR